MGWRGFTLVELLVVLAVGAILLTIAIPGYAFLVNGSRLTVVTNDLVTALHLARSEAIKRGMRITLCKSNSTSSSFPSCNSSAEWQQGWLIFVDGGTRGVIDASDILLRTQHSVSTAAITTSNNFSSFISYLPNGVSQGENWLGNGTVHVCVAGNQRDIIINLTGRPRLDASTC